MWFSSLASQLFSLTREYGIIKERQVIGSSVGRNLIPREFSCLTGSYAE